MAACRVAAVANKQTIQDVDARLDVLHRRLSRTVNEITELRAKRKKMVTGKIKVPPPPGKKVAITLDYTTGGRERRRVRRSGPVIRLRRRYRVEGPP